MCSAQHRVTTYVPVDREGWWGGPDTRRRCTRTDKVVKDERDAKRRAREIRNEARKSGDQYMEAYACAHCGWWHLGHGRRKRNDNERGG